jgi:hypothetical protein
MFTRVLDGWAEVICLTLLLLTVGLADAQDGTGPLSARGTYLSRSLDFRYDPPLGMEDRTKSGKSQIRDQAAMRHTGKVIELLLAMSSGPDNSVSEWRSLAIEGGWPAL